MTRVLVTGGRGFIGRQIVAALVAQGFETAALTSHQPDSGIPATRWFTGDLMDPQTAAHVLADWQPDILVHAAWETTHGAFWTSPSNVDWVDASLRLLRAFADAGGKRFVGIGSCAEYDWSHGSCHESLTPLAPVHPYGQCKAEVFRRGSQLADTHGLSFAWARIFHLYGPHEGKERLVPLIIQALLAGETARLTAGMQRRDLMHVEDVGAAVAAVAASPITGAINLGSGDVVPLHEVARRIGALTGRAELLDIGALPMRSDDPALLAPDINRLSTEVGFTAQYRLDAGLADTVQWWRDRR